MAEGIFRHSVASGDPTRDGVVIWTRVTGAPGDAVDVAWRVGTSPELRDTVAEGTSVATAEHDYTVHADVGGLEPDRHYFYGFEAVGARSPVARTRTLPADTDHVRFAICSCARYNAGFFNAYARIADREDLNFLLHLGDYIYEVSEVPPASQTPGADVGRPFDPPDECRTLEGYRARYSQYRLDPDVQRLHLVHPLIATVDDHEFADGAWREGSAEHHEDRDGPWADRKAAAFRARWEWMPYRMPDPSDPSRVFQHVGLGPLADIFTIDTRSRRDEPVPPPAMLGAERSQLGAEQFDWLRSGMHGSSARWRILGNGSVMAPIWPEGGLPESVRLAMLKLKTTNPEFTGPDPDQWDGYPAERERIFRLLADGPRNVVVLSGDVHVGLANELSLPGEASPFAVEAVTTSLTSQNLDDKMGWAIDTDSIPYEQAFVEAMPGLQWCDFDAHGYAVIDVRPERVRAEWWFVRTVRERADGEQMGAAFEVEQGVPHWARKG